MRLFSSYGSERFPRMWITAEPGRYCSTIMFPGGEVIIEPLENYGSGEGIKSPKAKGASE